MNKTINRLKEVNKIDVSNFSIDDYGRYFATSNETDGRQTITIGQTSIDISPSVHYVHNQHRRNHSITSWSKNSNSRSLRAVCEF